MFYFPLILKIYIDIHVIILEFCIVILIYMIKKLIS